MKSFLHQLILHLCMYLIYILKHLQLIKYFIILLHLYHYLPYMDIFIIIIKMKILKSYLTPELQHIMNYNQVMLLYDNLGIMNQI